MKDFFGTEIKVGDTVAFMQTGYRSLMSGTVIKLTEKTVFIKHAKTNVCSEETKQSPKQVIVKKSEPLTFTELRQLSLCAGWTLVLADSTEPGKHRAAIAGEAMKGFERVYGQGYHDILVEKAEKENAKTSNH